jgi:small GTP-binding protein
LTIKKKIVLLGDSAVGKTSLIRRYVFDQFQDSYISTIGTKATMKELQIPHEEDDIDLTLMIWDLIGSEGYHALHTRNFVGTNGAILVADLTREDTFHSLEKYWIPSLLQVVENVPMVFTCNKSDLTEQYKFSLDDLSEMASKYNSKFANVLPETLRTNYETSAKTGSNVELAFESLGYMVALNKTHFDPVKELYEALVAQTIKRTSDKNTPISVLDAIIVDFCEGFDDSRHAMPILREEINRAGIDIRSPSKGGILKIIEYIAEAESEFHNEKTVKSNLEKRKKWAMGIEEKE